MVTDENARATWEVDERQDDPRPELRESRSNARLLV